MKLSDSDLELLKTNPGGIYCIALKDEVWQAQLAELDDPDQKGAWPKVYIGQACHNRKIKSRINEHRSSLRSGEHHNDRLQRAWNLYGEKAFEVYVIETCHDDILTKREEFYIELFASWSQFGYNITRDATAPMRGRKHSEETRAKMRERAPMKNPETRAKVRAALKGRTFSEEHREKIRIHASNRSDETRAKMSAAQRGRKASPEAKEKIVYAASAKITIFLEEHIQRNQKKRYERQTLVKLIQMKHGHSFLNYRGVAGSLLNIEKRWLHYKNL